MRVKDLKTTLKWISSMLNEPRVGPGHRDQLNKAKRELETVARSGKFERDRIFRAVEIVSKVCLEIIAEDEAGRPR